MAFKRVFHGILYGFLALCLVLGLAFAAIKFLVLPNIEQWKQPMAAALSDYVGGRVEIGHLQARWRGLRPEIELSDVHIYDQQEQEALTIPYAFGRLKLSSLWTLQPNFSLLKIKGLSVTAKRITEEQVEVLGHAFDILPFDVENDELYEQLIQWLTQQGVLHISQSHLQWIDPQRAAGTLDLDLDALKFSLQDEQLRIQGQVSSRRQAHAQVAFDSQWQLGIPPQAANSSAFPAPQGSINLQLNGFQPTIWRRWIDLPSFLYQGRIDAQLHLQIKNDELHHAQGQVHIEHPFWADARQFSSQEPQPFVHARQADFHFELEQAALIYLSTLTADSPMPTYVPGAQWVVRAEDLNIQLPQEFPEPLFFPQLALHFHSLSQDEQERWYLEQLHVDSGVGQLQVVGHVDLNAEELLQSQVALEGQGTQIALPSLFRYFPLSLDADLRHWLQEGLLAGQLPSLRFDWHGRIADFEEYHQQPSGQFRLQAELEAAQIDYYQAERGEAGWPLIDDLAASLRWQDNHLHIEAQQPARLLIGPEHEVQAQSLNAQIEDLYGQANLTVTGTTAGGADSYQALWTHSNLGPLLGDSMPLQWAKGDWKVPITLTVPLALPAEEIEEQFQVNGQVVFGADSAVQLWSALAPIELLQGKLHFSETEARLEQVSGQWLGGPIQLNGSIGRPEQALSIQANLETESLQGFYALPILAALEGQVAVTAEVGLDAQERLVIEARSSLEGTQIHLPEPLHKPRAEQDWPLYFYWQDLDPNGNEVQLQFELAQQLVGQVVLDQQARQVQSAQLSAQTQEPLSLAQTEFKENVLKLDVQNSELDLDAWWPWIAEMNEQGDETWSWPAAIQLRLRANQARLLDSTFDYFTYTQSKDKPGQWRIDISSEQVAGTAVWHQQTQGVQPRGKIEAHFNRFDPLAGSSVTPALTKTDAKETAPVAAQDEVTTRGDELKERVAAAKADTDNVVVIRLTPSMGSQSETLPSANDREKSSPSSTEASAQSEDSSADTPPLPVLPDIELQIDNFKLRGYVLGQMQLQAQGLSTALGWDIQQFRLQASQEAELIMNTEGQGRWELWGADPALALSWETEFKDLGAYANHVGLDGLVRDGHGHLSADFRWPLLPWETDLALVSGEATLQLAQGRLETIRSRSAKMLELLSLQSLSRLARLDLDVGGLLKEGFPFHRIEGSIQLAQAWATTQDYRVVSPVGTLLFEGGTNIKTEEIDAQALVIPEIDMSGAALAAGVAVNPVLGFGAMIAQWLLRHPMAEAMTARYRIQGNWDDYDIEDMPAPKTDEQSVGPPRTP